MQHARAVDVDAVAVYETTARDECLDRPGRGQIGMEHEAVDQRRMPPPERACELGRVTRDAAVSVTGALRRLDVDEDRPPRTVQRSGH